MGAGFISSTLGFGGGFIFNPLLFHLGLHPVAASSTGMFLVMFNTFSNTVLYAINKVLLFEWAIYMSPFAVVSAYLGMVATDKLISRTGRASVLIFILAAVMCYNAFVVPINSTY